MARKTYVTKNGITSYSIGLPIPGRQNKGYAHFEGGVTHPRFIPSTFTTDDVEFQAALEKHSSFGVKFELIKGSAKTVVNDPAPTQVSSVKTFNNANVQSAIATLKKQGWEGNTDELLSVEDVQEAAKTIGIAFPNLK